MPQVFARESTVKTLLEIGCVDAGDGTALLKVSSVNTVGSAAEDAPTTTAPVIVGGIVRTANSPTTLVAGDAARLTMTSAAALVTKPFAIPEVDWTYASASGGITNTSDVVLKAAAGASVRNYLTGISIQNASATIATEVVIKDGSTVIWRGYVGTSALLNSAVGITFLTPLRSSANTALNIACITNASQVYVNAQGYTAL